MVSIPVLACCSVHRSQKVSGQGLQFTTPVRHLKDKQLCKKRQETQRISQHLELISGLARIHGYT